MRIPFTNLADGNAPILSDVLGDIRDLVGGSRFIGGAEVERFEESFAAYCGTRYAVGVANGTDAIELTLRALDIGRGDEVLLPANTFIATAEAVSAVGARPVFVDVDPATLLVTPETLETGRTSRTVAVIAVHLYGHPVAMEPIGRYADRHGLALLEDAAQAHGAVIETGAGDRQPAGSYGVAGTFSFYPGKNLGAWGDGGAVVTGDEALAAELRTLANHGRDPVRDSHRRVGRNSRLDALQAAVLSRKLPLLDAGNAARRRIAARYRVALGPLAEDLVEPADPQTSAWHLLVMRVGRREALRRTLSRAGITTGVHYPVPCHLTPAYAPLRTPELPVAEAAAGEVLSLPLWPQMSDAQVDRVVDELWLALAKPAPSRATHEWRPPVQGGRRSTVRHPDDR